MYNIFKKTILAGRYELSDILKKIDTIWVQGDITDEERTELIDLARENADPTKSYAPLQKQIDELHEICKDLTRRVVILENGGATPIEPTEEYPEYVQPTGTYDAYNTGDKVTYKGKKYECVMDNCVWAPDDYPQGWKLVETE